MGCQCLSFMALEKKQSYKCALTAVLLSAFIRIVFLPFWLVVIIPYTVHMILLSRKMRVSATALGPMTTRPPQRGGIKVFIQTLQWRMLGQDDAEHFGIAVVGCPVKRSGPVLTAHVHWPASGQHQADGLGIVVLRGIREPAAISVGHGAGEIRLASQQCSKTRFVTQFARQR